MVAIAPEEAARDHQRDAPRRRRSSPWRRRRSVGDEEAAEAASGCRRAPADDRPPRRRAAATASQVIEPLAERSPAQAATSISSSAPIDRISSGSVRRSEASHQCAPAAAACGAGARPGVGRANRSAAPARATRASSSADVACASARGSFPDRRPSTAPPRRSAPSIDQLAHVEVGHRRGVGVALTPKATRQ